MPTGAYKFTRERKDEYLEHLKRGVGRCQAAVLVGINVKTVEREVAKDQDFALARCRGASSGCYFTSVPQS